MLLFACGAFHSLYASVYLPEGEYYKTERDMRVKVLGGYVNAQRTWISGTWNINRAWNPLQIEYNNQNGSVRSITRNGDVYRQTDTTTPEGRVFQFDERYTITQLNTDPNAPDTGTPVTGTPVTVFRWQDVPGNTIDYDSNGRILSYANRNHVKISFSYDTQGRRIGVFDHFGNQVLWYTYGADGKLASIAMRLSTMNDKNLTAVMIVITIISVYVMALFSGLWWLNESGNVYDGLYLLAIYVFALELGYMICYRKMKQTYVFYLGYLLPAVLSTIGFVTGLIIK